MKKSKPTYEQVPATDEEKGLLMTIFKYRLMMWSFFFVIMSFIIFCCSFNAIHSFTRNRVTGRVTEHKWENEPDSRYISRLGIWLMAFSFNELIVLLPCSYFLYKNVWAFRKDAKKGMKNKIPYEIMRKEYFPLTNQYYFGLDDPKYLHHEIDAETYYNCTEGDVIYLYRAPLSGYTFEINGYFTLG